MMFCALDHQGTGHQEVVLHVVVFPEINLHLQEEILMTEGGHHMMMMMENK